jgi:hypothetical protein
MVDCFGDRAAIVAETLAQEAAEANQPAQAVWQEIADQIELAALRELIHRSAPRLASARRPWLKRA